MRPKLSHVLKRVRSRLIPTRQNPPSGVSLKGEPASPSKARPLLVPEEFQDELAALGLSEREFGPEDYRQALEGYLGVPISVRVFPDTSYPEYMLRLARSGDLALVRYNAAPPSAVVLVPMSLPPLLCTLAIYHELGHLAGGDLGPGRTDPKSRLARMPPVANETLREEEANLRAYYALLAGSLGPSSPYAARMYDVL